MSENKTTLYEKYMQRRKIVPEWPPVGYPDRPLSMDEFLPIWDEWHKTMWGAVCYNKKLLFELTATEPRARRSYCTPYTIQYTLFSDKPETIRILLEVTYFPKDYKDKKNFKDKYNIRFRNLQGRVPDPTTENVLKAAF